MRPMRSLAEQHIAGIADPLQQRIEVFSRLQGPRQLADGRQQFLAGRRLSLDEVTAPFDHHRLLPQILKLVWVP